MNNHIFIQDLETFDSLNQQLHDLSLVEENSIFIHNITDQLWSVVDKFLKGSGWYLEERFFENDRLIKLTKKSSQDFIVNKVSTDLILVGGGPSVLDNPNGKVIDKHNKVLRFSFFKTNGYEKFSGCKTDFWWTVNPHRKEDLSNLDLIFTHSYENVVDSKVYNSFEDKSKVVNIPPYFSNSLTKLVPFPSSGFIAINWFLKFYSSITITGFDWWKTEKQHYFNSQIRGKGHSPYLEKELIYNMCDQGKVKILL